VQYKFISSTFGDGTGRESEWRIGIGGGGEKSSRKEGGELHPSQKVDEAGSRACAGVVLYYVWTARRGGAGTIDGKRRKINPDVLSYGKSVSQRHRRGGVVRARDRRRVPSAVKGRVGSGGPRWGVRFCKPVAVDRTGSLTPAVRAEVDGFGSRGEGGDSPWKKYQGGACPS